MRLSISTAKNGSKSVSIICSVRVNGKNTSRVYKKLGTLSDIAKEHNTDLDGALKWCKKECGKETKKYNEDNEDIIVRFSSLKKAPLNEKRLFECGNLYLNSIFRDLKFKNIIRNIDNRHKHEFNLYSILCDLVSSRILNPGSKMKSYHYAHHFLEKPKYELEDIYRALQILAKESDYIQSEVYKNSNFIHPRNKSVFYYDCTNYYCEIQDEDDLRKYGKSKENRPNPIIGMGLFMDADGIPLAFDLHPGNMNEQLTLKPLEQKVIRDFETSDFIFCSDSGLGSESNKQFNSIGGRSFVITQSLKKMKSEVRDIALNPKQYRKLGSNKFIDLTKLDESLEEVKNSIYYKEIPYESKKNPNQRLIVTYSPKYKAYQRKIRDKQIERAKKLIDENGKIKKNKKNQNSPTRFITTVNTDENGVVVENSFSTINEDIIVKEEMYDGFYAVATDMEDDVSKIIEINKGRWEIEECFRIMKTEFEARPIYVSREDCIKAHFLICFLALLEFRLLEVKLKKKYTVEQIVETLRSMKLLNIQDLGYSCAYTRTPITCDLNKLFGFETDNEFIKKAKMKNILKQIRVG